MRTKLTLLMLMMAAIAVFAQPAHYITFNGTDQYMRIPHHEDFNIAADESFTLTGWVRNETYTEYPRYVGKRDIAVQNAGSERSGYEFFGTGSAGQSLGLNTPTSTSGHALSVYTGVTVPAGEWMHFALVVDRNLNEIRIYQNGQTNSAWAAPVNAWAVTNTHDVLIGAGNNGGAPTYYCNGSFGNVRFYSMALSAEEMAVDLRVDAVHFGITKIRQMMGGAFGHLNPKLYTDFNYHRKQDILLCSNMRFKLTWFNVDFENELRICNVKHSDRKMQLHYESVINIPGVKEVCLLQPNVVSAPMFLTVWKELKQHCFFYDLNEDANVVCWMYSFDTSKR